MYSMSIIVPVYRVEKYLRTCLDSVVRQTLKNIEVIIVDDGSDDGSAAIAKEYVQQHPHFSYLYKENGGLASARAFGMKAATGEYIAFLDSDDWVDDCAYETLYSIAVENNKPDVIMYRSHGEGSSYFIPRVGCYDREAMEKELLPWLMPHFDADGKPHYLRFSNCMKVYKRSFLEASGVYYHDGILIMEDVLFTLDCLDRAQSFYYSDQELYHITVNPNSLSRTPYNRNKTQSMLLISEYIREYLDRDKGFDYGDRIYSAILYFLEAGIANELKAPKHSQCIRGIRRLRNSEVCRWYIRQAHSAVPGWYGKVQRNLRECGAAGILYRMKYRGMLRKWKSALLDPGR